MDIREKIKKILEKAASTPSEAEASMLLAKAQELMEKHQIEVAELADADDPIGTTCGAPYGSGPSSYKPKVAASVAAYYGCMVVRSVRGPKTILEVSGPQSARVTAELMTDYVWGTINKEAARLEKEGYGKRGTLVRQLTNAFVVRIAELLRQEKAKPTAATGVGKQALVVLKDQLAAYMRERYADGLRPAKAGRVKVGGEAVQRAAAGISLSRQTTGASHLRLN